MRIVLVAAFAVALAAGNVMAATVGFADFGANVIRNGTSGAYTTSVSANSGTQSFSLTAVGGGKVAIGTSAMNGLTVGDFQNFSFTNSVAGLTGGSILYPNAWITDGAGHYAFLAMHYSVGAAQNDDQVYSAMTSAGGMASVFDNIGIRVYATGSDVDWIFPGAVKMAKANSWTTALWKSSTAGVYDPVRLSDISNLLFGSPFSTATLPGIASNPQYTLAGTGDPQTPDAFYLMAGDTSGSVQNYEYIVSNMNLEFVPEPASMTLLALGALAMLKRRR